MGAAIESFIMVIGWAGFIAVLFLLYSLITRVRRGRGNRGVFQRMPLLLPSIAFVISIFIILQLGIAPIQDYRGNNSHDYYFFGETEVHYNVFDPGIAYIKETNLSVSCILEPDESIDVILEFYLRGNLTEVITTNLIAGTSESTVSTERILDLAPGNYIVKLDVVYYEQGAIVENYDLVEVILTQNTLSSIYPELLAWTNYQFAINVGCFFFIIGGLCIGKEDPRDRRVSEYDQETETSGEYRTYDE